MEFWQRGEGTVDRVLDPNLFFFLLDHEVKRARRYQNFICLLHLRLQKVSEEELSGQQLNTCHETLGDLLSVEMRDSDLLTSLGEEGWLVLLPYADLQTGKKAKSRFEETLRYFDFKKRGLDVSIDQWVFPAHWTDTQDLFHQLLPQRSGWGEGGGSK